MRKKEFTIWNSAKGGSLAKENSSRMKGEVGWFLSECAWTVVRLGLFLLLWIGWSTAAKAQCTLVCNDNVNVSLPGPAFGCEFEVKPANVLQDTGSCPGSLVVTIMDQLGNVIPGSPKLNSSHIGQTFVFQVAEAGGTGNSCWGTLDVEDKLPPDITGCDSVSVFCIQNTDPTMFGGDAPTPTIEDCSPNPTLAYVDAFTDGTCADTFSLVINRTWTATDIFGHSSTCVQVITVKRITLANPSFTPACPSNKTFECNAASMPSTDPTATGFPQINLGGQLFDVVPGADNSCQLAASFNDEVFDICGGGLKILRTWTIFDWCLPAGSSINPFSCIQVIKVEDTTPPNLTCPATIVEGSVSSSCSTSLVLPPATVSDDCSSVDVKVLTPMGQINGNGGLLLDVPVGTHLITYVATDACGNISTCKSNLIVEDDTPPVTICDEFTTVSLTIDGTAIASAASFDDGSNDNCGITGFKVRRMPNTCQPAGTVFDDFVNFDCCDLGEPVTVVFRVFDAAGNYNDCMVTVSVQDKIDPVIVCPPNKTIACGDPIPPFATPIVSDNCPGVTIDSSEVNFINSCGVGTVVRTYTATDVAGRTATCQQTIFVQNFNPFDENDILWPSDFETFACDPLLEPEDLPSGFAQPFVTNDVCDLVAVTHEDQLLPVNPPACFKILRTWIVIDWCQFDPNDLTPQGYWQHVQVLKVQDLDKPVLTCPPDITVNSTELDCGPTLVQVDSVSVEDCSNEFNVSTTVDLFSDGSTDLVGSNLNLSGIYPMGKHTVTVTVEDFCGNQSDCSFIINVIDGKKPTPVCVNGLSVDLMPDLDPNGDGGIIQLSPEMFNEGSFDNCTDPANLQIFIEPTTFSCINLGTNIIKMTVVDESGNSDFCETYVIIQDNMGVCHFDETLVNVAGAVQTETGTGVEDVMVDISGNGPATAPVLTNGSGDYLFNGLQVNYDYTFTPGNDASPLNGVTTFDLVLMTRHILNVEKFDSPYKLIAADVNNSGTVTTLDVVELRKMILQINTTFPNNTSWRFVDKSYQFPDLENPFQSPFPEVVSINDLTTDNLNANFVGIKIGDVNESAIPSNLLGSEDRSASSTAGKQLTFLVENPMLEAGQTYGVAFKAKDFVNILGYQFTLQFNQNILEFLNITPGELTNLSDANFGFSMLDEGIITTSWNNIQQGQTKNTLVEDNTTLFSLNFRANANARLKDLLGISSRYTKAEAYAGDAGSGNTNFEMLDVALQFDDRAEGSSGFELFQNQPNPFRDETTIRFQLPQANEATLRILDVSGKILRVITSNFAKGYNEIRIGKKELQGTGVLYYQLQTPTHTATRRMILID